MEIRNIEIRGAKENNLKNIDISIPTDQLVCVTGVSGCGKSSLVYDTLYAESRRVFFESMGINPYGQKLLSKPNVEAIENLRPAISLSQNSYNNNPRSTVGTVTDISHYLRSLYALATGNTYKPKEFSANNPSRFCPTCQGTGEEYGLDPYKVVPDKSKTLEQGAITYYAGSVQSYEVQLLRAFCLENDIDLDTPFSKLSIEQQEATLFTEKAGPYEIKFRTPKGRRKKKTAYFVGAYTELESYIEKVDTPSIFAKIRKYLKKQQCTSCSGLKLVEEILAIKLLGTNISEVEQLHIHECINWLEGLAKEPPLAKQKEFEFLIQAMIQRLKALIELNVSYLSLSRSIPSLSSGELQRVRIASHLSTPLVGLLYIFDEPCKGLHPRDIKQIVTSIKTLVANGNSVIAIEHDKQFIAESDHIIELGPHGGPRGGYVLREYSGKKERQGRSYEFKAKTITPKEYLSFSGINFRTLRNQDLDLPLNALTCITGVSGSGKSTLATVIEQGLLAQGERLCAKVTNSSKISGLSLINQAPIGKTPRSTVVSYLGIYDSIRNYFSSSTDASAKGIPPSHFSMNVPGGRCDNCQGTGKIKFDLNYLPDIYATCDVCNGRRFTEDILDIKRNGLNINDVLSLEVENLVPYFVDLPKIQSMLNCLIEVGLGYLKLGEMSMNISGGEAQRIKLSKYIGKKRKRHLFILDEPTNGLAYVDIKKIAHVLRTIVEAGNTVVAIEHNLDFIMNNADYLVDLGCHGGKNGGVIVFQGTPQNAFSTLDSSWYVATD